MNKRAQALHKVFALISGLSLLFNSILPAAVLPLLLTPPAHAQEETTPTDSPTPDVSPTAEPTIAPTEEITPTPEISPEVTVEPTVVPSPTDVVTPTIEPTTEVTPDATTGEPPSETGPPSGQILDGASTVAPTATPAPAPTEEHGQLQAVIISSSDTQTLPLTLDANQPSSSATLTTDKKDYGPTDSVIITGSGFTAGEMYTLVISSQDPPPVIHEAQVTADGNGSLLYTYQLDGNYRPNYKVEAKNAENVLITSTTFTDSQSITSATLNGGASVSVAPSASITAAVTGTLTSGSTWHGTQWRIATTAPGTTTCANTTNYDTNGSGLNSGNFTITAPAAPGTYNVYFIMDSNSSCGGTTGSTFTMANAVTVTGPDLTVAKTNNVSGNATVNTPFNWVLTITNGGTATAAFGNNGVVLTDQLPTSGATYGSAAIVYGSGVTGTMGCSVSSNTLTCTSNNGANNLTIPATKTVTVTLPVTPTSGGTLANPRNSGTCAVDPSSNITESNEGNNNCANSVSVAAPSPTATPTPTPTPNPSGVTNPTLPQACGLDIAFVLDNSDSIDSTELGQMKTAMTSFVTALSGTPTQYSVTKFGTTGSVVHAFTSNTTDTNNAINGVTTGGGFTNWQDGLTKAWGTYDPRTNPNLVIFASDGDPNRTGPAGTSATTAQAVADAQTVANTIKTAGTRMLVIGISSSPTLANLEAISGTNVNSGNVLTSDVITTDFANLATQLATYASQSCGGTITARKVITGEQNPTLSGWHFNINGQDYVTDAQGYTQAVSVAPATYSVTEAQHSGYSLTGAVCTGATNNGSQDIPNTRVTGVQVASNSIVSCTFTNDKNPVTGHLVVQKTTLPAADPATFTINATGSGTITGGGAGSVTDANDHDYTVTAGTYSVTETVPAGWSQTGNTCTNVQVAAGQTANCLITNTKLPTLAIYKVCNPTGDTSTFNLQIDGSNVTTGTVCGGWTNGQIPVSVGTHTVGETGGNLANYTAAITGDCASNGSINLTAGQNKSCTITNTRNTGKIELQKDFVGTPENVTIKIGTSQNGTQIDSDALSADGTDGEHTVNTGNYFVSESLTTPANYASTLACYNDLNHNNAVDNGDTAHTVNAETGAVTVGTNDDVICVLTNTRNQGRITFQKVVDDQSSVTGWTFTINGVAGTYHSGDTVTLDTGSYTATESGSSDYAPFSATGACASLNGSSATLTVTGQGGTCTFTNHVKRGNVIVTKYHDHNANGTKDAGDEVLDTWEIHLSDMSQFTGTPVSGSGQVTFSDLFPGSYTLGERMETGWFQSNISCDGDTGVDNDNNHPVQVKPGQTVHCSIGNYKSGHIIVTKDVVNPDGKPVTDNSTTFPFAVTGSSDSASLGDGDSHDYTVSPGTHAVSETQNSNYDYLYCDTGIQGEGETLVTVGSGQTVNMTCTNRQKIGRIGGFKWEDANGNGQLDCSEQGEFPECEGKLAGWTIYLDLNGNGQLDEGEPSTTTNADGNYSFDVNPGTYRVCEVGQESWNQTYPDDSELHNCHSVTIGSNDQRSGSDKNFGNEFVPPVLHIAKTNDTGGADRTPSSSVGFTLTVTVADSPVHNLQVTDLPAGGFVYRTGSWKVFKNGSEVLGVPEPGYHSPGLWDLSSLGTLIPGDTVELQYVADIAGDEQPGLYKDLAYANAQDVLSDTVYANLPDYYVGTEVNVVVTTQNGASHNVVNTVEGQVLGASTELPSTGASTFWLIVAFLLITGGIGVSALGWYMRRKYE